MNPSPVTCRNEPNLLGRFPEEEQKHLCHTYAVSAERILSTGWYPADVLFILGSLVPCRRVVASPPWRYDVNKIGSVTIRTKWSKVVSWVSIALS